MTVLCVGFGPWVQEELMIAVAGAGERYFHVSDSEALNHLFGYRNAVLSWPFHESLAPQQVAEPRSRCRLGKHSARAYPQVDEVAEERDPFLISALDIRKLPLAESGAGRRGLVAT